MTRRTLVITYAAAYLLAIGAIVRYVVTFRNAGLWPDILLGAVYLVLLFLEPRVFRRNRALTYTYLLVQTAIICTIARLAPVVDFWAILACPLVVQVMHGFPPRTGYLITGLLSVIMALFLVWGLGPEVGLPLAPLYAIIYFLLATFIALLREAESARAESQQRQVELQEANRQLQLYTAQAEEVAVMQERSRLARELHDSVTQSLHSSTLLAEAGQRLVASGDPERARGYLRRIAEISQQALREMRLLVYELRPMALAEVGLAGALHQRLDAVERRSGVAVTSTIDEELVIPAPVEAELFRVATEALNNALKHASPTQVTVALRRDGQHDPPCFELSVTDDGVGFDPLATEGEGGLGLVSMRERIERLGGELAIVSSPGEGTQVRACVGQTVTGAVNRGLAS